MKISLLHPSRSRPEKSFNNSRMWLHLAGAPCELVVSLDHDDPKLKDYQRLYSGAIVNENRSVVDATNKAALASRGDILVYLSDDFECFPNWGQAVIAEFQKHKGPTLIKVDDCLQPFHVAVLTIPIMNRELYDKLGYFFHPGYRSMFVDCDLYEVCKRNGSMKMAPHLKFPHNHVSNGKAKDDETYRRSAANWNQGLELFNKRKAVNFRGV